MIRSLYRSADGAKQADLTVDRFAQALKDPKSLLWVDFQGEPPEVCEPILHDTFGFHPLAIDDALRESHEPKLDDWGPYLYLVLHAATLDTEGEEHLDTLELDLFVGSNHLVTHHDMPIAALDRVWGLCQRDDRRMQQGGTNLVYVLIDEIVADYMPVFDDLDDAINAVEDQVLDRPTQGTIERILALKRVVLRLRRIIAPQREVLNKLARDEYAAIEAKRRIYFRDVYDHLVRMYDINESMRELLSSVLDTYLSAINNRMNNAIKTLTMIATLFMPISFLAGFFGMNFFTPTSPPRAVTGPWFFAGTLLIMVLAPLGMYLWMRRRLV